MKARTGKIARLPKAVREQLNQRLADGEQGEALLKWLHSLPEVLEVLVSDFEGRPILKQNLSEWRQGGFRDWEARQERLELVQQLCEEAEEVQAAASDLPEKLAALLATRFASLMAATAQVKDWSKPRQRAQLMELGEAIAALQRNSQGASRLKLEHEQLDMKKAELQLAQEAQKKRDEAEWREWTIAYNKKMFRDCKTPEEALRAVNRLLFGHDDEEMIRAERKKWREKAGLPSVPGDATLFERAESMLQTHALAEELAKGAAQGGQTQSNRTRSV
ncbi:MAG TPA: hypothetical protein DDZ88_28755 [Verrucomicrobiales bacterium]|nr:hypothetical protein [Verrucomicrobiales bacterium]